MTQPWPPPPDLDSLKELIRDADIEGFIVNDGAPEDEYDGEAEALHASIGSLSTADIRVEMLMPILLSIWSESFNLHGEALDQRAPSLVTLAKQIARFFGPDAAPQVRTKN